MEQKETEGATPWVRESTDGAEALKPKMDCVLVLDPHPLEFNYLCNCNSVNSPTDRQNTLLAGTARYMART